MTLFECLAHYVNVLSCLVVLFCIHRCIHIYAEHRLHMGARRQYNSTAPMLSIVQQHKTRQRQRHHKRHQTPFFRLFSVCFPSVLDWTGRDIFAQEFDPGAVPEPNEPVYRAAAAAAVNIHPLARTFEGLVPVSLDAPPPRPKRKGKQVREGVCTYAYA